MLRVSGSVAETDGLVLCCHLGWIAQVGVTTVFPGRTSHTAPVISPLANLAFQGSGQVELDNEIVNALCSLLLAACLLPAASVVCLASLDLV